MVNGLKRYFVSQFFQLSTLVFIMSRIFPAVPGTYDAERREASGLMPGSHPGMDAISMIAVLSALLAIVLYKDVPMKYRALTAFFWILLAVAANPIFR